MPSRRAHTNSHHGCLRCKSKRVKCDQTQPKCHRCQRHGSDCVYRHIITSYDPFAASHAKNGARMRKILIQQPRHIPSPRMQDPMPGPFSNFPSAERQLFHHYINSLARTKSSVVLHSNIAQVMEDSIIRNAIVQPFVQYSILSFAALHLSANCEGELAASYLVTALRHKDIAIARFRPVLNTSISPENCEAGIAASTTLIACFFALPMADRYNTTGLDYLDILAQLSGLFQGLTALMRLGGRGTSALVAMRANRNHPVDASNDIHASAWPAAQASLEELVRVISELDESDSIAKRRKYVLSHAAEKLVALIHGVVLRQLSWMDVCLWLACVDTGFVELLHQRDPLALVLMGYWVVSRKGLKSWWVGEWTELGLTAIQTALNGQYDSLLQWCYAQTNIPQYTVTTQPMVHRLIEA